MKIFLLFALLGLVCGNTYYIATTGSSSGTGAIGSPFSKPDDLYNKGLLVPGTIIYVRGGTYMAIKWFFNEVNGITLAAYPGEKPIIDATNDYSTYAGFSLFSCSNIVLDGLTVRNTMNTKSACILGYQSQYVTVQNCETYNCHDSGITGQGYYWTLKNNYVHDAVMSNYMGAGNGMWASALAASPLIYNNWQQTRGWVFLNNVVQNVWGEGLNTWGCDNATVRGNTVINAYSVLLYTDSSSNVVVESNLLIANDASYRRTDNGNYAQGIQLSKELYNPQIPGAIQNFVIRNNVIVGACTGIVYWNDQADTYSGNTYTNVLIEHNTIVNSRCAALSFDTPSNSAPAPSAIMRNNILYGAVIIGSRGTNSLYNNNYVTGFPASQFTSGSISADPQFVNPTATLTWASAASAFALKATSPCISNGYGVNPPSKDYTGRTRSTTNPSMGAIEFVTITTPTPNPSITPAPPSGTSGFTVFDETVNSNWVVRNDRSNIAIVSTYASSGSKSYMLQTLSSQTYGYIEFDTSSGQPLSLSGKTHLRFAARAGQTASVLLIQAGPGAWSSSTPLCYASSYGPSPLASDWTIYTISISDLGITAGVKFLSFADNTGGHNTFYIDQIQFVTISNNLLVYDESVSSGWSQKNARSTVTYGTSPAAYSGSNSLKVVVSSALYGTIEFDTVPYTPLSMSGKTHVRFAARTAYTNAQLTVQASGSDWTTQTPLVYFSSYGPKAVDAWSVYTVPLTALGATDGVKFLVFADRSETNGLTFYIDKIEFITLRTYA